MKPCPICKTENPEEQWSACSEIRGTCWQTGSLDCSNPECYHGVSVSIDSDLTPHGSTLLENLWDLMADHK